MRTSQLALTRTGNPDVINFANAEIAEQVQVSTRLARRPERRRCAPTMQLS